MVSIAYIAVLILASAAMVWRGTWKLAFVCTLLVGGVYALHEIAVRNFSLRYRLTVSVDDNGQIRTGTSVIETRLESPAGFFCFPFCGRLLRFYGNAPTIDLGAKGLVFVIDLPSLINRDIPRNAPARDRPEWNSLDNLPFRIYGYDEYDSQPDPAAIFDKLKNETRPVDVPPLWLPAIVHFHDINNPKTIEEVDPLDMAATLGPGVHFVGATLQITNDPITQTPGSWPMWLASGPKTNFDLESPNGPKTYVLSQPIFKRN